MSSRAAVFASIRRSLGVTGDEATRRFEVEMRLKQAPPGVVPKRGQGDVATRVATFKAEAERAQASVTEVREWADAPAEIARYLRESNCPATLRMGDDPRLTDMPWSETTLEVLRGPSDGHDLNAVSAAFAGIAETGTLALVSGPDNPTTLNFLPDNISLPTSPLHFPTTLCKHAPTLNSSPPRVRYQQPMLAPSHTAILSATHPRHAPTQAPPTSSSPPTPHLNPSRRLPGSPSRTLALVSGPDNPTTLNFLPDNHIVVLPREAIEADYESVFAKVRSVYGKGDAPRTLNFITGPSRSADIEQTLLLGAHGPRRLHIVVVG